MGKSTPSQKAKHKVEIMFVSHRQTWGWEPGLKVSLYKTLQAGKSMLHTGPHTRQGCVGVVVGVYLLIYKGRFCGQTSTMAPLQTSTGSPPFLPPWGQWCSCLSLLSLPIPREKSQKAWAALGKEATSQASSSQEPIGAEAVPTVWLEGLKAEHIQGPQTQTEGFHSFVLWPVGLAVACFPNFPLSFWSILFGSFPFCVNSWSS